MTAPHITYMDRKDVFEASPFKNPSSLYKAIKEGKFPAPDHFGTSSRWRSDLVYAANAKLAAEAELNRAEFARKAAEKAQQLTEGRRAAKQRAKVAA